MLIFFSSIKGFFLTFLIIINFWSWKLTLGTWLRTLHPIYFWMPRPQVFACLFCFVLKQDFTVYCWLT